MNKERSIKEILVTTIICLVCMVIIGLLLVVLQTTAVYNGQLSVDTNLNVMLYFLITSSVGVVVNRFSKRNNLISVLLSVGVLYVLTLLLSVVVFDAFSSSWIYILLGCVAGGVTVIISALLGSRKRTGWKKKKYNC